ncbi:MerR family DNA-binding transcriptional regulator [Rubripirellula reticaptiva]|uniref:Zinc-responsive transcriptional regulator n=1 Tax=Rubripirellula reticaptiva TaxID=2528013 RepID=A0A5C6ENC4_9BACT|nr:MerR family DNA-binding transcriptional regulator [Rubripirellula reticaptiva]TWU51243.1 zinc-responsive transcriptional regulator [Rubripirellula reticaptiva]
MSENREIQKLRGLMKVGEAAEFCGVTAETLRNWDRSGKLVARRNPVTGYRYYRQKDLEKFLQKVIEERAGG